ncbi:Pyruvate dehydrogenase protein X component, mitochondrial [Strongyloides ratti]|uniref:Acetyltransferase component of pyruvate dehydrogenase complex n=1 Tax=Strongyloides ratti TaxID=34506 RepID=A0A090LIE0_STRRB|nr:Pyruvate dehydrogenase protein X component, mitochondrial [Strongyloides ratti]CEF69517.2 Pyruvate dehydrogenase protein X component, mitochondrial [Strongyloides ratti]
MVVCVRSSFRNTLNGVRVPFSAVAAASFTSAGHEQMRSLSTNPNVAALVGNYKKNVVLKNLKTSNANLVQMARQYCSNLPSHNVVKLPALSPTMETGTIASWQKKEGDQLFEGDLLCEIETDKATMGFETPEEGYLAKIFLPEGSKDIPIGKPLCIIVQDKEDVAAFANYKAPDFSSDKSAASTPVSPPKPPVSTPPPPPPKSVAPSKPVEKVSPQQEFHKPQQKIFVTPFAKKLAKESGINLTNIQGSGPHGRILASDIEAAKSQPQSQALPTKSLPELAVGESYTDIPLTNMRKTIAKRLTESKTTIPHYYLTADIDVDKVLALRAKLNSFLASSVKDKNEKPQKLSINDFIIKATAKACKDVPEANSFFMDTFVRQNDNVDVSVAVSTDSGLITPIVRNADLKGISRISAEVAELAKKAREGKLQPHEYQGGTFTVSNLGMFGSVSNFSAIINPPQSCILAIGAPKKVVVVDEENNGYKTKNIMQVTMSCDHRVVDGAVGARYLKYFKQYLEDPKTMLL